jgi:hypothetical protein
LETVKELLYRGLRCGLYHAGMARPQVWVSRTTPEVYSVTCGDITVNPRIFVEGLCDHFGMYVQELRRESRAAKTVPTSETSLLENFQRRFDAEMTDRIRTRLTKAQLVAPSVKP